MTDDQTEIEAVARAINLVGTDWDAPDDWLTMPDYGREMQRDKARAAIAALDSHRASQAQGEDGLVELYRDIFAEITAKAQPICGDPDDPERITGYRLPVGPIHRAAGKLDFQMFDGEKHLAKAAAEILRLTSRADAMREPFIAERVIVQRISEIDYWDGNGNDLLDWVTRGYIEHGDGTREVNHKWTPLFQSRAALGEGKQ
jgi:hypothetical protein